MARPRREQQLQEPSECEINVVDLPRVRAAQAALPDGSTTAGLAGLFGALADPTRLRMIAALEQGEMCVCDIAATLGLTTSAASHQLRILRTLGLVRPQRSGRMVFYALDDDHVRLLYRQALEHVAHGRGTDATKGVG
jgi:ArsR family transcriptional regulator, lead/cadmium/zinc/bismuth-responsive transcriptional repressor